MKQRENRLVRVAQEVIERCGNAPSEDLSDIDYLALFGARAAIRNHETTQNWRNQNRGKLRQDTAEWTAKNPERHLLNTRIISLRNSITRLANKKATKRVDWPARVEEYKAELAKLISERAERFGGDDENE